MSDADTAGQPAPEQQKQKQEQLPAAGGSYERQDDGALKRVAGTDPAEDRAASEPDERGTARLAEEQQQADRQADSEA